MLTSMDEAIRLRQGRKETYYITFETTGSEHIEFQTRDYESAKYLVKATDQRLIQEGFVRTDFNRRRNPGTRVTSYIYRYGRRN